jgi:hypothetical protein
MESHGVLRDRVKGLSETRTWTRGLDMDMDVVALAVEAPMHVTMFLLVRSLNIGISKRGLQAPSAHGGHFPIYLLFIYNLVRTVFAAFAGDSRDFQLVTL